MCFFLPSFELAISSSVIERPLLVTTRNCEILLQRLFTEQTNRFTADLSFRTILNYEWYIHLEHRIAALQTD